MKPTSIESWAKLKYTGVLGQRQLDALIALIKHGPMTGQEVTKFVPNGWKRLSELEKKGAIVPSGTRICSVTHETATEWKVVTEPAGPPIGQLGLHYD